MLGGKAISCCDVHKKSGVADESHTAREILSPLRNQYLRAKPTLTTFSDDVALLWKTVTAPVAMVVSVDGTVISRVVVNVSMEWRDMHKRIGEDAPK